MARNCQYWWSVSVTLLAGVTYFWAFASKCRNCQVPAIVSVDGPLEILVLKHPACFCNLPAKWLLRRILRIHLRPSAGSLVMLDASVTDKIREGFPVNDCRCLVDIVGRNSPIEELG